MRIEGWERRMKENGRRGKKNEREWKDGKGRMKENGRTMKAE